MKTIIIFAVIFLVIGAFTLAKKKIGLTGNNTDFLEIGQLIYPSQKDEFRAYFSTFIENKSDFINENVDLIDEYGFDNVNALEATYLFGDNRGLLGYIDWRGEENENEVEEFIEDQIGQTDFNWDNSKKLRQLSTSKNQRDGEFVIDLFKAVDKDLKADNKQLLFFDLGFDSYVFIATSKQIFDSVREKAPSSFHGTEKLKK
jgi:hypothetical protein